jgi:hypothetical protein
MRQLTSSRGRALRRCAITALVVWSTAVHAQTTAFTFQGQLANNGAPASGSFDMQFKLYDALTAGNQIASPITQPSVQVTNGAFTTQLDFGAGAFPGATRFLELSVRTAGSASAYAVQPRTQITSTPYAIRALSAASADAAGALSATSISTGTDAPNSLPLHVDGTSWFQGDTTPLPAGDGKGVAVGYSSGDVGYVFAYDYATGTPKKLLLNGPGGDVAVGSGNLLVGGNVVDSGNLLVGGNVGIGTSSPTSRLTISEPIGGLPFEGLTINQSVASLGRPLDNYNGSMLAVTQFNEGLPPLAATETFFLVNSLGRVGIGTASPDHRLGISGGPGWTSAGWTGSLELDNGGAIGWKANSVGNRFGIGHTTGGLYFFHTASDPGTVGSPVTYDLVITDNSHVSLNVLEIQGGADLAEKFDVGSTQGAAGAKDADLRPGLLVSIDPQHPGKLVISDRAYDRRVAGVISGAGGVAPGMVMGQTGSPASGEQAVALNGRVYCWADASGGPIRPGDLLTTSAIPGDAMRVTNYARAQGAIVGKAMSGLKSGRGLVLALVTLQ